MTDDKNREAGGKAPPNRSEKGQRAESARRERLAAQLRANLRKRKQQQRSRAAGDDGEWGGS